MDTTATIPTGSMAERWKFKSFVIWGLFCGALYYPLFGAWTWGGGWLSQLGNSLEWGEIVRGYEYEKGKFVVLDDEELERLAPEKTGNIDLRVFVPRDDIDPILFERAYYMVPAGANPKAYRLLARVMEDTRLAGVATFVPDPMPDGDRLADADALAAWLATARILPAEELEPR